MPDIISNYFSAKIQPRQLPALPFPACCLLPFIPPKLHQPAAGRAQNPHTSSQDKITPGVMGTTRIFHVGSGDLSSLDVSEPEQQAGKAAADSAG